MKVIIVDDEPKAISLLSSYLAHFSNFTLVGSFRNGLKALEFLNANSVDLVFLDIHMPHISGLSLAKMIPKETAIVFTTAYSEYALESYEVQAVDYLLKPISLERFSKAIAKITTQRELLSKVKTAQSTPKERLFIKSGLETHQICVEDIQYLKKDANYIYYVLPDKKIMARENMTTALSNLPAHFLQVQKSYIVNLRNITVVTADFVHIANAKIPIGSQFKSHFLETLQKG